MIALTNLSASQLRHAAEVKERIESLQKELSHMLGATAANGPATAPKKRRMSAAGRAAIAAGARARWAKIKRGAATPASTRPKRKMSAAAKARLSAIAKARWKKARAAGKRAL